MIKNLEEKMEKCGGTDNYFKIMLEYTELLFCISNTVKQYRESHSMSQKELALILEVEPSMISKLETGNYNPTIKFIFEIGKKLESDDYSLLRVIFNKFTDVVDRNFYTL